MTVRIRNLNLYARLSLFLVDKYLGGGSAGVLTEAS